MTRQIKFRAKRLDNGKWAYGGLIEADDYCIIDQRNELYVERDYVFRGDTHFFQLSGVMCDEKTIGQFTGLFDKNGKEIYEGDVLRSPLGHIVVVKFGYKEHIVKHDIFTDSFAAYGWIVENVKNGITDFLDNEFLQGEVIGNIHDNPELIDYKQ